MAATMTTERPFNIEEYQRVANAERDGIKFLQEIWPVLNAKIFGGNLKRFPEFSIADFDDRPTVRGAYVRIEDGGPAIFVHRGVYFPMGSVDLTTRQVIASQILVHEMIHQKQDESGCRDLDWHGAAFLKESRRISRLMGNDYPVTLGGELKTTYWPFVTGSHWSDCMAQVISEYREWAGVPSAE